MSNKTWHDLNKTITSYVNQGKTWMDPKKTGTIYPST